MSSVKISTVASVLNIAAERCRIYKTSICSRAPFVWTENPNSNVFGCDAIRRAASYSVNNKDGYTDAFKVMVLQDKAKLLFLPYKPDDRLQESHWWAPMDRSSRVKALKSAALGAVTL